MTTTACQASDHLLERVGNIVGYLGHRLHASLTSNQRNGCAV